MSDKERSKISDLKKCDFTKVFEYFKQKTEERKAMSKEEKKAIKEENLKIKQEYGTCNWDNHIQPIANYKIEPPGLFRGRGEHPKMGNVKKRIQPADVIINCGK
jgi:DNA topoisomerase-1